MPVWLDEIKAGYEYPDPEFYYLKDRPLLLKPVAVYKPIRLVWKQPLITNSNEERQCSLNTCCDVESESEGEKIRRGKMRKLLMSRIKRKSKQRMKKKLRAITDDENSYS